MQFMKLSQVIVLLGFFHIVHLTFEQLDCQRKIQNILQWHLKTNASKMAFKVLFAIWISLSLERLELKLKLFQLEYQIFRIVPELFFFGPGTIKHGISQSESDVYQFLEYFDLLNMSIPRKSRLLELFDFSKVTIARFFLFVEFFRVLNFATA